MSGELISRSVVKDIAAKYGATSDFDGLIDQLPAVDAEPVRHGRWIIRGYDDMDVGMFCCSLCGDERFFGDDVYTDTIAEEYCHYCPNCGAKMDGGKDDAAD